ncbi:MAG: aspartate dehydrogenase domain-containing protein [Thermodesulfobacteriota bacterium]
MTTQENRIGIVGCGTIGSHIARRAHERQFANVDFICDVDLDNAKKVASKANLFSDLKQVHEHDVDLVVEAANADVMREIAIDVLSKRNFMPFTMTALADDEFRKQIRETCLTAGTRLFIPHGGILGLDGVFDGRHVIEELTVTTTKHPKNFGLDPTIKGTIYEGPVRGACEKYPRNVNVHAAFALMGLGFDKTRSVVIADPETNRNTIDIHVKGEGLEWNLTIVSIPVGLVTGAYTPESAASSVARVLCADYDIVLA